MKSFTEFKKELLKNKKVLKAYQDLEPEFALIEALITARIKRGLTQKTLAHKIGTKQSAISRLEHGDANPTMSLLKKIAHACNKRLEIQFK